MNEQLKFSWGHIVALIALIVICYFTFVGTAYLTDCNFMKATVVMIIVGVVLLAVFIGAQILKATNHKFGKKIVLERCLIFGSPLIFIACLYPYFHCFTVYNQNAEISQNFTTAIKASQSMFTDYEAYANQRIANYNKMLGQVIANRQSNPQAFAGCGFSEGKQNYQKDNMLKTLRLQLLSENFTRLKTEAIKWIGNSSKGASIWNVFLLGNTRQIKAAIHDWDKQLSTMSAGKLSNEEYGGINHVETFNEASASLETVDKGLDSVSALFSGSGTPSIISFFLVVVLYCALLFPYFLQDRNTKSMYTLAGKRKGGDIEEYLPQQQQHDTGSETRDTSSFDHEAPRRNDRAVAPPAQSDDDDSFTL